MRYLCLVSFLLLATLFAATPRFTTAAHRYQPVAGSESSLANPQSKPVLQRGARGPAVIELQRRLNVWIGRTPRSGLKILPVSATFGSSTETAVRAFQRMNSLPVTGVVAARTWAALPPLAAATRPPVPAVAQARVKSFTFAPARLDVKVGATVVWSNDDPVAHTITHGADGKLGGAFNSALVMAGNQFSFTFTKAGTYSYFCMPHPWMIGTVRVIP